MNEKRKIKGFAKTTGKYTLNGIGKGLELIGRGSIKTVNALVKNPKLQKIVTSAGVIAASIAVPAVGVGLLSIMCLDAVAGNDPLKEINKIIRGGNVVTRSVCNKILSPTLRKIDRGMGKIGRKYQDKIDGIFR